MATNRELLKEAIAEAKAVKEMAIANAKNALEESFTPRIKEMFSQKIQEMEEEEIEESYLDMDPEGNTSHGNVEEGDDIEEEELNLDELLAELDDEDESLNESDDEEEEEETEDEDSEETEGEPLDLEDMTDEDLKQMISDVISDMVASGELEPGDETEELEDETSEEEEMVNIDELLKEIEEEEIEEANIDIETVSGYWMLAGPALAALALGMGIAKEKVKSFLEKKKKEGVKPEEAIEDLKDTKGTMSEEYSNELEEAYSTINTLRGDLNEVNLLNAKLLYTNKVFKSKNLTESQKVKVLTAFDKASTVKETKLVYETLNEGFKSKSPLRENLGSASKSITPSNAKTPIIEDSNYARMRHLAFYDPKY